MNTKTSRINDLLKQARTDLARVSDASACVQHCNSAALHQVANVGMRVNLSMADGNIIRAMALLALVEEMPAAMPAPTPDREGGSNGQ